MDYEDGERAYTELRAWAVDHDQELERNEAQTRFDLIDRLLTECLAWNRDEIRVERHWDREYSDYELGTPYARLVIEAKKEGLYFELPSGWDQRVCKLSTVFGVNVDIEAAVEQALGYAQRRGIPYAAVANGWQMVAFIASRTDGVPPLEGHALVFSNLEDIAGNFRTLWDNLSAPAVKAGNLAVTLQQARRPVLPPKLSAQIDSYPGVVRRTALQQSMQILGEIFIEDLASLEESEVAFLLSCYATSGALSEYALVSREILRTRYALLFDEASVSPESAMTSHGLNVNLVGDVAAAAVSHRPILLLGDVGVGKSTFIRNLIYVEAREQLEHTIVLYLDFGKRPTIAPDLEHFVGEEIKRQLMHHYDVDLEADNFVRGVYHGKIEQFGHSLYAPLRDSDPEEFARQEVRFLAALVGDSDEHIRNSLEHITRARRQQIVIFLDNIDQRDESFQDRLYIIAQTMAESWPVTVFLALRPQTFNRSRRSGALSAYQPRVFTISPPRIEIVLQKRLAFALEKLRGGGLRTRGGVELNVDINTLERYLTLLERSIVRNDELVELFENASEGNVRQALGFVETFVGSGHINLERMMDRIGRRGRIRMTLQISDVLRAILYGESQFYDGRSSPLPNLFDIRTARPEEHFLLPVLLEFIRSHRAATAAEGFVEAARVADFGQGLGFTPENLEVALHDAASLKLLTGKTSLSDVVRAWRITSLGSYSVMRLVRFFAYYDAIVVDTPILNAEVRRRLDPLSPFSPMKDRLVRAEVLLEYFDASWQGLAQRSPVFDWPSALAAVSLEIAEIGRRLARQ